MKFETFNNLCNEVANYDDIDMYITERGWQDCMDEYIDADKLKTILITIYDIFKPNDKNSMKNLRSITNLSQAKFCKAYANFPKKTLEMWESGHNDVKPFTRALFKYLAYIVLQDNNII